jgi:hypothetical protein
VHVTAQRRTREDDDEETPSANAPQAVNAVTYKASVTSRIGGFGVTLSTGADGSSAESACELAAASALASDIDVIKPEAEPIFDRLRYLALGLGRMLRFSISSIPSGDPSARFECRVYEKDDWHLGNRHRLHSVALGETPKAAFLAALYGVCQRYQVEADASPKGLEDIAELTVFLRQIDKSVSAPAVAKQQDGTRTKFTASVTVTDRYGNTYTVTSGPVATAYAACRSCALQVYKHEADAPPRTLLSKLIWQLDGLCDSALRQEETQRLVELSTKGGFRYAPLPDPSAEMRPCEPEMTIETQELGNNGGFYATVYYGNRELGQHQAAGSYVAELAVVASAIEKLALEHPELPAKLGLPYATVKDMAADYQQTCTFSALDALKGAKVSPYATLGACCSRHFNQYYGVTYTTLDANAHKSVVHVDDGSRRGLRVIGEAISKTRGQAWKAACMNALRCNFPVQLAQVQDRADFMQQGGGDATGSGGSGAKDSAADILLKQLAKLPREQRIEKCQTLLQMVETFGASDLSWRQVNMHAEQDAQGHWRAELRRRNEKDGSWIALAAGHPAGTKKDAVKLATFEAAQKYFPADLDRYLAIGRSDVTRAEVDHLSRSAPFTAANPLLPQLLSAIGGRARSTLHIEATNPAKPRLLRVSLRQNQQTGGGVIAAYETNDAAAKASSSSGEADTGEWALVPAITAACNEAARVSGAAPRVAQLWQSYRGYSPPGILRLQDLVDFLFGTIIGAVPTSRSELIGQLWHTRLVITVPEVPDCPELIVAHVTSGSKKESLRAAQFAALQHNFHALLTFYRRASLELKSIADEVLKSPRYNIDDGQPLQAVVHPSPVSTAGAGGSPSEPTKPRLSSAAARKLEAAKEAAAQPPPPSLKPTLNPPPALYKLLKAKVRQNDPDHSIVPEYKIDLRDPTNIIHTCFLRLVPLANAAGDPTKLRKSQLVGTGEGRSKTAATHHAALAALDALFTAELEAIITTFPEWADEPNDSSEALPAA